MWKLVLLLNANKCVVKIKIWYKYVMLLSDSFSVFCCNMFYILCIIFRYLIVYISSTDSEKWSFWTISFLFWERLVWINFEIKLHRAIDKCGDNVMKVPSLSPLTVITGYVSLVRHGVTWCSLLQML